MKGHIWKTPSRTSTHVESQALDTRSCRGPQTDFAKENLLKQGLNEEKAKLVKPIQEKEELLQRLKLVKMYGSDHDRVTAVNKEVEKL